VVKSATPARCGEDRHDELIATLGSMARSIDLNAVPPGRVMMSACRAPAKPPLLQNSDAADPRDKRKVLMACSTAPPGGDEQLSVLGRESASTRCRSWPARCRRRSRGARWKPQLGGLRRVLLDNRRAHHARRRMMAEAAETKNRSHPHEVLLVADALTAGRGQSGARLRRARRPHRPSC